jgi:hypothetical protein
MTATVAMYNSGTFGWLKSTLGQVAYLGTWSPIPGQDQPSALGGDGTNGAPNTAWPRYNRVAIQPADWVGPNQVAWFQFAIRAPQMPGTYDLYIRPLIEGALWMEDYGIFWRITVPAVTVGAPAKLACSTSAPSIGAGSTQSSTIMVQTQDASGHTVFSDNGRSITLAQSGTTGSLDGGAPGAPATKTTVSGVATFVLTQPAATAIGTDQLSASAALLVGCSTSVTFIDGHAAPTVTVTGESHGTQTDERLAISDPASNVSGLTYSIQRTKVTRTTAPCDASSGTFVEIATLTMPPSHSATYVDPNLPQDNSVYCYRVGSPNPATGTTAFGYSNYAVVGPPVGP